MATNIDPVVERVIDISAPTVYARASWDDAWVELPHLQALRVTETTGERLGQASLAYQFGDMQMFDDSAFFNVERLSRLRQFVKITFSPHTGSGDPIADRSWYGIITQDDQSLLGDKNQEFAGDQVLQASSLEWCLGREIINKSYLSSGAGSSFEIARGLPVNVGHGMSSQGSTIPKGNRSAVPVSGSLYYFTNDLDNGAQWTAKQFIQYLVNVFPIFSSALTWDIDPTSEAALDWLIPHGVVTNNRTLFEVINQIISRRVGLTWSLSVEEATGELLLKVHSFASASVTLPSGATLPANTSGWNIKPDNHWGVDRYAEYHDGTTQYEQIVVTGMPLTSTFTIAQRDQTLEQAWTENALTMYQDAGSAEPGYDALSTDEQREVNARVRGSDKLGGVYTAFRIPDDWDGNAGNGAGGVTVPAYPGIDEYGNFVQTLTSIWTRGHRFERQLALLEGFDYSSSPGTPTSRDTLIDQYQRRRPFCAVEYDTANDKWAMMDRLHDVPEGMAVDLGTNVVDSYSFSSTLRVDDAAPIVKVMPSGGPPHLQAGEQWYDDAPAESDRIAELDWENFATTVTLEGDQLAEARWPVVANPEVNDFTSIMYIRFGDRYRMDYLVAGTILDIGESGPVRAGSSGWVRNDFGTMQDIARAAYVWHSVQRFAVDIDYNRITSWFSVGDMIVDIGEGDMLRTANSVITAVSWDFVKSTTSIRTQFVDELDFAVLV